MSSIQRIASGFLAVALVTFATTATQGTPLPSGNQLTWFSADVGVTQSGGSVSSWGDQATTVGGTNNATQGTPGNRPSYISSSLAGLPTIRFDGSDDYLDISGNSAFLSNDFTWFIVANPDYSGAISPSISDIVFRSNYSSPGTSTEWGTYLAHTSDATAPGKVVSHARNSTGTFVGVSGGDYYTPGPPAANGPAFLLTSQWAGSATGSPVNAWQNGTATGSNTGANRNLTSATHNFSRIGANTVNPASTYYKGDISELIVYNTALSRTDTQLTENYLSAKYSGTGAGAGELPLASASDYYDGDDASKGHYDWEVFGIGRTSSSDLVTSRDDDKGFALASTDLADGEWALAGHKLTTNAIVTTNVPVGGQRWDRSWYLDTTGSLTGTLTFDFSDAGLTYDSSLQQLLYRASESSDFAALNITASTSGDQVSFNLSLSDSTDGYYTLGYIPVPEPGSFVLLLIGAMGMMRRRRNDE